MAGTLRRLHRQFWEVACTTETDADTDTQGDIQSGTDGSDTKTDTDIILGELIAMTMTRLPGATCTTKRSVNLVSRPS